jgi:hypothetical protein
MLELKRWYPGISFAIYGEITKTFSLNYDRNKPLPEVISLLNASGKARITLEGNLIQVNP